MTSIPTGVSDLQTVPVNRLMRARLSSAPVTLPLRANYSYARLRHLQGVPGGGDGGFSLHRLRALDALVERLAVARGGVSGSESSESEGGARLRAADLSPEQLDRLIASYHGELQTALGAELAGGHAAALGGIADTGAVFSFLA